MKIGVPIKIKIIPVVSQADKKLSDLLNLTEAPKRSQQTRTIQIVTVVITQ